MQDNNMSRKKSPTFHQPNTALKQKVGEGGIPAYLIKQCQDYIESNPVDFAPFARKLLEDLEFIRSDIDKKTGDPDKIMANILNIVMQLKANGSMFHYQLISMVSDVMLRFLEIAKRLDNDFLDILGVYIKALKIVLNKKLTGNGGKEGYVLTQELHNACLRYYARYNIPQ